MKVALILDDGDDSTVVLHLLLRHRGYHTTTCSDIDACLLLLSSTSLRYMVCVGSTIEALAALIAIAEEPALQRHVYLPMLEQGERLPTFAKLAVQRSPVLVIERPLHITATIRTIALAERCVHLLSATP
jgi:hypothetical protein